MPGPDNLYVFTESILKGKRNGTWIALGLCTGLLVHIAASASGVSILLLESSYGFFLLKYFGIGYILYLIYQSILEKPTPIDPINRGQHTKNDRVFSLLKKGFLLNVLNPKVSLFFIAFLPQFISPNGFSYGLQIIILGFIFIVQGMLIMVGVAQLAGQLNSYVQRSSFWIWAKWIKIIVLLVFCLLLILLEK